MRGRVQPNGSIVFPMRGPIPKLKAGYTQDPGDPYIQIPIPAPKPKPVPELFPEPIVEATPEQKPKKTKDSL